MLALELTDLEELEKDFLPDCYGVQPSPELVSRAVPQRNLVFAPLHDIFLERSHLYLKLVRGGRGRKEIHDLPGETSSKLGCGGDVTAAVYKLPIAHIA